MTSSTSAPRILVVGAGPSGLVMALSLVRNGCPVRLIDKEPTSRLGQRGAGIMPRSLELFNILGVGDEIIRRATPPPQAVLYKMPEGVKVDRAFEMWPAVKATPQRPFPNVVMMGQDHLEHIMRKELRKLGCAIEWGTTLLSFEQLEGGDSVRVQISRPDGDGEVTESARFDYLVGTDGARGVVRKALGLTFVGETSNAHNLVVGDVMVHGLDTTRWHMWGEVGAAWLSLRPTEVPFMFSFLLSGSHIDHTHIVQHPEALASIFVEYTGGRQDLVFGEVVWLSTYRPSIRMVDKFGVGRVFVAGDSAHVHSITGGQGMNTGIQDSFNLGWKLALVQRGLAPESLLRTYTEERTPVVASMLNQITALLKDTWAGKNDDPSPRRGGGASAWKYNGGLLQLGVNCRWSSVVVDEQSADEEDFLNDFDFDEDDEEEQSPEAFLERQLAAGDRAPDAPGLLVLKRRAPDKNAKDLDAQTISLFRTFLASHHTVLIFSNEANRYTPVIHLLAEHAADAVQSVIVVRGQGTVPSSALALADCVLEDRGGHAYGTYALRDGCDVVVVRPDGLVGAIVRSRDGLRRYLRGIFKRQPT
ncbi:FAD binding domain-containing protein [Mycena metata]|uniref:FAD binding domain-containing protein n=1 Tax=Mycena metata TaxID=1033252 RepID=A0AAD7JA35_9AGAR|nr:FAD binding domain-containing protein [Mycena metata]